MKKRFLLPLIICVVFLLVSMLTANALFFIISVFALPIIALLFYYDEKDEIIKY